MLKGYGMWELIDEKAEIAEDVKIGHYCIIKAGAKIGQGTIIDDFSYIAENVQIGNNNYIGKSVHLYENTQIGNNNYIEDFCLLGQSSKHIGYHFYKGRVIIGDNNFIGNNCTIDSGNKHLSHKHPELNKYLSIDLPQNIDFEDATIIGNRCYILNNVTIHHNCRVGLGNLPDSTDEYDTVICTGCCLNGFVQVRKGSELSSGTYIREFASLGEGTFTAMMSHIVKDVLPFSKILKNKNTGTITKLVSKFSLTEPELAKLRDNFANKRSHRLGFYE